MPEKVKGLCTNEAQGPGESRKGLALNKSHDQIMRGVG